MSILNILVVIAVIGGFGGMILLVIGEYEEWCWSMPVSIAMLVIGVAAIAFGLIISNWNEKTNGVELTGTVTEIHATKGSYGCTEWLAEVETSDGKTYTVTLGTRSRSKYQSLSDFVLEGDTVTGFVTPVIGRDAIYDGNIRSISRD